MSIVGLSLLFALYVQVMSVKLVYGLSSSFQMEDGIFFIMYAHIFMSCMYSQTWNNSKHVKRTHTRHIKPEISDVKYLFCP